VAQIDLDKHFVPAYSAWFNTNQCIFSVVIRHFDVLRRMDESFATVASLVIKSLCTFASRELRCCPCALAGQQSKRFASVSGYMLVTATVTSL